MNPTRCDASGSVYFRAYKRGDPYGASITKLDTKGQSLSIDISKIADDSVDKPSTLKFTDFAVAGGMVYVPAVNEDEKGYVLELAASDGTFQRAVSLEDAFYPLKIGVFSSGAFIVIGAAKHQNGSTGAVTLSTDTVMYDASGRLVKHLGAVDNDAVAGRSHTITPEQLSDLTLGLVESAGSSVYFLQPSDKLSLIRVQETGTVALHELWSLGKDFVPINFRALGDNALVEYAKDPKGDGKVTRFVLYDVSINQALAIHDLEDDVRGAFACYDWRNTYTFISNIHGHRSLLTGTVR